MINNQTLIPYASWGNNGNATEPDDTKYAEGFVPSDVLPAQWLNWFLRTSSTGQTALNSGVASMEAELNNILTAAGITPSESVKNQVLTAIKLLNVASATKLATARSIQTNLESGSAVSFDGSANVTPGVSGILPIANGGTGNSNGNAASATKLETARTFKTNLANGTAASFNGTSDALLGVTGVLPVANGGTGNTTNQAATCAGNAGSATKLQTARNIGGVAFDGTADINLPGVNIAGNQNTSGSASYATTAGHATNATYATTAGHATDADSATKLSTARTVDGMSFDGTAALSHYGTCSTATDTNDKVATVDSGFALVAGARVSIKFTNACSASGTCYKSSTTFPFTGNVVTGNFMTLNVNGTGAKIIYISGEPAGEGFFRANELLDFEYDGTYWHCKNASCIYKGYNATYGYYEKKTNGKIEQYGKLTLSTYSYYFPLKFNDVTTVFCKGYCNSSITASNEGAQVINSIPDNVHFTVTNNFISPFFLGGCWKAAGN